MTFDLASLSTYCVQYYITTARWRCDYTFISYGACCVWTFRPDKPILDHKMALRDDLFQIRSFNFISFRCEVWWRCDACCCSLC